MLAALSLGFNFRTLSMHHEKGGPRNETVSSGHKRHRDRDVLNAGALIGVITQFITIIAAIILIVVAALNKTKYRRLLLVWLLWCIVGIVLILLGMIVGAVVYRSSFIDIIVAIIICVFIVICFWFVYSYYLLLATLGDHPNVDYDASAKDSEILTTEKSPEGIN